MVTLFRRDRLYVEARLAADGGVLIEGQDLRGAEEVEYVITVRPADLPALSGALGGEPLERLAERGEEIVGEGESTWLGRHGVPHQIQHW